MTVSATSAFSGPLSGNGSTTVFPFSFKAETADEVQVFVDGVEQTSGFTVAVSSVAEGGSVTFATPPANGAQVLIASNPSFEQQVEFENAGAFLPESHDEANDRAAIRDIYLKGRLGSALRAPVGESIAELPAKADRAGKYLAFDADGNPVETTGGGSDGSLRSDIAQSNGSTLVGFLASFASAVARSVQSKLRDILSVKDFGAAVDGATDDAAAVALAATNGTFIVPGGTLKTDTAPASFGLVSFGASFSGTAPLDGPYPAFGPGALRLIQKGSANCLIGIAHNTLTAGSNAFPCGVTGYGRVDNAGNAGFGIFGRADLYGASGIVTNEFNSFNYGADPSATFPVDRSIGTAQSVPTAVTAAAGGTKNSHTAYYIGREGSEPQSFLNGVHAEVESLVNYFLVLSTGSTLKFWVKPDGTLSCQGLTSGSGALGYSTGAGGSITQATSRTTGVTINKACGQITLVSAAGSATWQTFTVTNSLVTVNDTIRVSQRSGTDKYQIHVTKTQAGSFDITFATIGGTTTEQPVFNFAVIKGAAS
jgi:hypothetical protein